MKHKFRAFFTLLFAFLLCASCLFGCQNTVEDNEKIGEEEKNKERENDNVIQGECGTPQLEKMMYDALFPAPWPDASTFTNGIPDTPVATFTEFLDNEGFGYDLNMARLRKVLKNYRYNGQQISLAWKETSLPNYIRGGTFQMGYCNQKYPEIEVNSVYTNEAWENLILPFEVELGDTLAEVLEAMALSSDLPENVVPDEGSKSGMTLYRDEKMSLVFHNYYLAEHSLHANHDAIFSYSLVYTDQAWNAAGTKRMVRTVTLDFSNLEWDPLISFEEFLQKSLVEGGENTLCYVSITVTCYDHKR